MTEKKKKVAKKPVSKVKENIHFLTYEYDHKKKEGRVIAKLDKTELFSLITFLYKGMDLQQREELLKVLTVLHIAGKMNQ